ncbi:MAG: hypothetical protein R3C28_27810 [Pirellulaceae bacterium]
MQGVASENAFSIRNQADGQSIGRVTNAATLPDASVRFRDGLDELSIWGDQSNDSFDVDTFANTSIHIEGLDPDVPTPGDRLYVSGANSTTLSPENSCPRNEVLTYTGIETAFVTDTLQIDVVGSVDDDTIEIDLSSPNGPKYLSFGSQAGTSVVMDQLPNKFSAMGTDSTATRFRGYLVIMTTKWWSTRQRQTSACTTFVYLTSNSNQSIWQAESIV